MDSTPRPLDKKRYRATVRMVARFGIQLWLLEKGRFFRSKEAQKARRSRLYTRQAQEFCTKATQLGGLLIKLGQHLSTHIEILPKEYTAELSKLQDAVPPVPTQQIVDTIEREFSSPLSKTYSSFSETPIAAASLGQVHEATLVTGERVAVKVLRPDIERIIAIDLESLRTTLRLARRFTPISTFLDVDRFFSEFETTISRELNLNQERASADTFRTAFAGNRNVFVPKTYWAHTTTRVLTLEYVDGVKINELEKIDALGADRKKLARTLVEAYLRMVLHDGFFHADPHPGNVLVNKDGAVVLLDFGMVGYVDEVMRERFIELGTAVFLKDTAQMAQVLSELGFLRPGVDLSVFARSLQTFVDRIGQGRPGRQGAARFPEKSPSMSSPPSMGSLSEDTLDELGDFMRSQPFQLPDNVTFLFKAATTVIGLCLELDPEIDLVEEVRENAPELLGSDTGSFVFSTILDQGRELLPELLPLIKRTPSVVAKLDSGELTVRLGKAQERRIIESGQQQGRKTVRTLFGAAVFLGGILLLGDAYAQVAHHVVISYVMMALGGLTMLMQAVSAGSRSRRRRPPHPTFKKR